MESVGLKPTRGHSAFCHLHPKCHLCSAQLHPIFPSQSPRAPGCAVQVLVCPWWEPCSSQCCGHQHRAWHHTVAQRMSAHPAGDALWPTKEGWGWGEDGQRRTRWKENALSAMNALTLQRCSNSVGPRVRRTHTHTRAHWAGMEEQQAAPGGAQPSPQLMVAQDAAVWAAGHNAVSCAVSCAPTAVQAVGTHGAEWERCAAPLTEQCCAAPTNKPAHHSAVQHHLVSLLVTVAHTYRDLLLPSQAGPGRTAPAQRYEKEQSTGVNADAGGARRTAGAADTAMAVAVQEHCCPELCLRRGDVVTKPPRADAGQKPALAAVHQSSQVTVVLMHGGPGIPPACAFKPTCARHCTPALLLPAVISSPSAGSSTALWPIDSLLLSPTAAHGVGGDIEAEPSRSA